MTPYDPDRRATYSLPDGVKERIRRAASDEGKSPNRWVVEAILEALGES